jgi:hypothetical protein
MQRAAGVLLKDGRVLTATACRHRFLPPPFLAPPILGSRGPKVAVPSAMCSSERQRREVAARFALPALTVLPLPDAASPLLLLRDRALLCDGGDAGARAGAHALP